MGISLKGVDTLFPIPLYRYVVDEPGLNDRLAKEIAKRHKSEGGLPNKNRLGWQSERDFFVRTEPGHIALSRICAQALRSTIHSLDPTVDFAEVQFAMNGWINVNPPGGYNGPHQHSNAILSGVYYVDVPRGSSEKGGAIEFLSPHPVRLLRGVIKAPMFLDRVHLQPKAGELIIFPGQLPHWVHPNDSGKQRVTIAFNASMHQKRIGAPGQA